MDARDVLTDLVKSIQKNMLNARKDKSKARLAAAELEQCWNARLLAVQAL
jgi:hypothetical protein